MINYHSYIRSQEWKKKRGEFLARKFYGKCMCCADKITEFEVVIHHLRYDNLGNERMNDLVAICRACHDAIHFEEGDKLDLTAETTLGRYSKLRFKLQLMHNKRISKAKKKNEDTRKRYLNVKLIVKRERRIKSRLENKLNNPRYDKENKKFIYAPYESKTRKREQDILKEKGIRIVGVIHKTTQ